MQVLETHLVIPVCTTAWNGCWFGPIFAVVKVRRKTKVPHVHRMIKERSVFCEHGDSDQPYMCVCVCGCVVQ